MMIQLKTRWKNIGSAVLVGYGITLVLLLVLAGVMTYTPAGEKTMAVFVSTANLIGIFFAGLWAVRRVTSNGWLIGGVTGIICPLLLRLVGVLACDGRFFTLQLLGIALTGFLAGALGGITGINLGFRARQQRSR